MKIWQKCMMVFSCCWLSTSYAQGGIHLLTEDYPPYNMIDAKGKVGGLSTEIVREMFARSGFLYQLDLVPWMRAFNSAVLYPNSCVYSTTRTDNREHQFKWVGPLVENVWVLYAGPQSPKNILTLENTRRFKIGGYSGDAESQYLIAQGFNVELTPNDDLNPRKLALGRIDFWASSQYRGHYLINQNKLTNLKQVLMFNTVFLYLACNRGLPDNTIHQLNDALQGMRRDGFIARVQARYSVE